MSQHPQTPRELSPSEQRERRVNLALERYLTDLEAGRKPDREAFLAQHADLRDELVECLDGLEFLHQAAPPLNTSDNQAERSSGSREELPATVVDYRVKASYQQSDKCDDSTEKLAADLRRVLSERPDQDEQPAVVARTSKWSIVRQPIVIMAIVAIFICLSVISVFLSRESSHTDQGPVEPPVVAGTLEPEMRRGERVVGTPSLLRPRLVPI